MIIINSSIDGFQKSREYLCFLDMYTGNLKKNQIFQQFEEKTNTL